MGFFQLASRVPGAKSLVANGAQWSANINQALGSKGAGVDNLRELSSNIRNPNVDWEGKPINNPQAQVQGASTSRPQRADETAADMSGSSGYGSTGGGGSASTSDPATAAFYGDRVNALRAILGAVPGQRDQGLANIEDSHKRSLTRTNEDQSRVLRDVGIKKEEAGQNKLREVNKIDSNVANTADSFRRIVAMGHAGNSSFARDFVPMATARMGSQQRGEAFDAYGRNARNLDLAEADANDQHKRNVEDLDIRKNDSTRDFLGGISDYEQQLNDQAAEAAFKQQEAMGGNADAVRAAIAPFSTNSQALIDRVRSIFEKYRNPQFNVNPINVAIPELEGYTADPLVAQQMAQNPGMGPQDLPYLPMLKKRLTETAA